MSKPSSQLALRPSFQSLRARRPDSRRGPTRLGGLIVGYYLQRYGQDRLGGVNLVGAVTKLSPELLGQAALAHRERLSSPDLAERSDAYASFLAACFAVPPLEAEFRRMLVFNGMVPREVQQAVPTLDSNGLDEAWANVPKLLVTWGDEERHTRFEMSHRVLDLNPAARMSIYEGVAHAPFYERPERWLCIFLTAASCFCSGF